MDYEYIYKVVCVGDRGVGKTSLFIRYVTQHFDPDVKMTIGIDHYSTIVRVKQDSVKVQLWDSAGAERFRSVTKIYWRSAPGAIVVYDITNAESFANLAMWISEVREQADPNVVILIVGNKTDLHAQRAISTAQGEEFARANHVMFTETSALSDDNVTEAFNSIVERIHGDRPRMARGDSAQLSTSHAVLAEAVDLTAPVASTAKRLRQACCG